MTIEFGAAQTRWLRLRAQGLAARFTALKPLLAAALSLQAQDYQAATLGVRARSRGLRQAQVADALQEGLLAWTWLMRGTLHFVAAADLPWLLPLFGPEFIRQSARRYRQLGLDAATRERATDTLRGALAEGPQTRAALKARLQAAKLPAEGQAGPYLLRHAALEGVLVCVPGVGGRPDFQLLEARAEAVAEAEAMKQLARRYLRAFGPAAAEDLARWSGLPLRLARTGMDALGGEVTAVRATGRPAVMLKEQLGWLETPARRSLQLAPAFDGLLLSHVARELILPGAHSRQIHPGGGILRPTLLLDGEARGRWQLRRGRRADTLQVMPFGAVPRERMAALKAEVADVGRFLGREVVMQLEAVEA